MSLKLKAYTFLKTKEYLKMRRNEDRIKLIRGMLEKMEVFRSDLMGEINKLEGNEDTYQPVSVYPMANIERFNFKDLPIYQFSYHGSLQPYEVMTRQYIKMIRHYYQSATYSSISHLKLDKTQKNNENDVNGKTVILFAHFFNDLSTRDLDNRNKKHVLDAIKITGIIEDDNWQDVILLDVGYLDRVHNHLQVFVFPEEILGSFLDDLNHNQDKYIENKRFEKQFEQFEKDYKNEKY